MEDYLHVEENGYILQTTDYVNCYLFYKEDGDIIVEDVTEQIELMQEILFDKITDEILILENFCDFFPDIEEMDVKLHILDCGRSILICEEELYEIIKEDLSIEPIKKLIR